MHCLQSWRLYLNSELYIKTGDTITPFRISIYDKRDDFTFRIVNFPHMDSNIPANPAYGVYISQLARICTSKVDFMNRLRGLSLRLRQQGFLNNLLQRTFTKFFNRHGLIDVKYGATLREMRFAIQLYLNTRARTILFCARALFINLIDVCIKFVT